jgi:aspartyl-tRNA(Asn)/glutamyl-tRNA(Gln) amidotransferase subunit A
VFPFAPSFDAVGPLGRSAEDCALLLQAMAATPPALDGAAPDLRGVRIGVVGALFEREIDPRVAAVAGAAVDELRALGAHVERVELELLERMGTIQQAMQLPEAAAVHAEWLRTRLRDYGDDVRTRLLAGHLLPPEVHAVGARARELACREVERVFARVDLLVAPAMPTLPPRLDEEVVDIDGRRVPYRVSFIRSNSTWSLVGVPAISVPCGFLDGLPVGLVLAGPRFGERAVLRAAHAYQQASDWHERRPVAIRTRVPQRGPRDS